MSVSFPPRRKLYIQYYVAYIFTHLLLIKFLILTRLSSFDLFIHINNDTIIFIITIFQIFSLCTRSHLRKDNH